MLPRYWKESAIKYALMAASSMCIVIVLLIFLFLFREAAAFAREPGLSNLAGARWVPVSFQKQQFGLGPLLSGSLLVTALATLFAVPFGVCGAVYIAALEIGRAHV